MGNTGTVELALTKTISHTEKNKAMLLLIAAVIVGLMILAWSSDKFVDGATALAHITGISPLIVGIVIIGFGTSAPEMLVSVTAALNGTPGLALGNAVGSNIANIALILGITALLIALPLQSSIVRREIPLLLLAGLFSFWLMQDGQLTRNDAVLLLGLLAVMLGWMIFAARGQTAKNESFLEEVEQEKDADMDLRQAVFWTLTGLVLLVISSKILVWGASGIASALGISDLIIGLTIVALGTSLPELAASLASARRGVADLAVGNIIGSNLFNNLGVIGLAALVTPFATPADALTRDLPLMLGLTLFLIIFAFTPPKRNMITRWEGLLLLAAFIAYQALLYYQSTA